MAAGIPALKVSMDSVVVSSSGSWFHSLMLDRKKDSFYVLVLLCGTLYLYWWPLVAAPSRWRCKEAGINYHGMYDTKHHYDFCLLSSVLECFPGKALDHASDAAGVAIVSCHKSGGSPLDSFYLFDVVYRVRIPYTGTRSRIFNESVLKENHLLTL